MLSKENLKKLKNLDFEIISENPLKAARYFWNTTYELNSEEEAIEEIEAYEENSRFLDKMMQSYISDKEILDWLERNVNSITHDRMTNSVDMSGTILSMTYRDSRNRNRRLRATSIREAVGKAIENE